MRDVATETDTPPLDCERVTAGFYAQQGKAAVDKLSASKDGVIDGTHLSKEGCMVSRHVMAEALKSQVPKLAKYIN
jgi:hypothetical protein